MKNFVSCLDRLPAAAQTLFLATAAAVLALLIELCLFQLPGILSLSDEYPETSIDLSSLDGWNGEALAVLPESPSISFDGLSLPVRSVTVTSAGPAALISGNIGICDEANAWKTVGAGSFSVVPGGEENTFTVRLDSRGNLTRLRLNFTDGMEEPVFLRSVTLNARRPLALSFGRIALIALLLLALFFTLRFRLYAQDYDPKKKSHRLLNLCALTFCLAVAVFVFYAENPAHEFLRPYPSAEEVRSPEMVVDAYMQQLDAFEKGQIELDLDVNPALEELDNPYDKGERDKKEIEYHWDRAYYNGKYYSYFGLAPLFMVYYPVWFLTGMLPSVSLAGTLLAVFAILGVFAAVQGLFRLFAPRANLLLFLTGETAVVCGSFLYLMQSSLSFYYLPLLAAAGWFAAFLALACFASLCSSSIKRGVLFFLCGICVVMLVLSRPNTVLLAITFAAPLFLHILFDKNLSLKKRLCGSALPFLIPVLIGGAAVMYYNQIRFDSVFEFGTSYQLTESDIRWNHFSLSLHHFGSMLYHYFAEPFARTEFFPFLRFTAEKCVDFGNYLYQEYSAGLFVMPLNLAVFLLFPVLFTKKSDKKDSLKKQTFLLSVLGILALGYLNFLLGGIHIRYVCDLALLLSLCAFFLLLDQVHFDGTRSARILYAAVLVLLLITIGRGLLVIFSNETNDILQLRPDLYLKLSNLFRI